MVTMKVVLVSRCRRCRRRRRRHENFHSFIRPVYARIQFTSGLLSVVIANRILTLRFHCSYSFFTLHRSRSVSAMRVVMMNKIREENVTRKKSSE